jgi:hypothetical protein
VGVEFVGWLLDHVIEIAMVTALLGIYCLVEALRGG